MTQAQVLIDAAQIILTVIFWVSLLFPGVVGTFWKWWKTDFGNSYVWKVILIAVVASPTALHEMLSINADTLWYRWYTTVALGLIPPVLVWRGLVLWNAQREGKSKNPVTAIREWARSKRHITVQETPAGQEESCDSKA